MRCSASRSPRFLLTLAASLTLPLHALVDWGENWGTMIRGQAIAAVPLTGKVGFGLLVIALVAVGI